MSNFIRVRQETGSYCGPAVMQMLLSAIGIGVNQDDLVNAYASKEVVMREGIPLVGLAAALKKIFPDLVVWRKNGATVGDLKDLVDSGYAVAVDWQGIFQEDEYHDDQYDTKLKTWWKKLKKVPELKGDQGHYCIVLEVNIEKGYLRFADPYGHYAGKDRFVALWEFGERWWDDRLGTDENGKEIYVLEERLLFLISKGEDGNLREKGLVVEKVGNHSEGQGNETL